jgi:hypothetical protein
MKRNGKTIRWIVAGVVWLSAVSYGTVRMFRYSGTPGLSAAAPVDWPAEFPIKPAAQGVTLLVTLHPRCTCSRATLAELSQLMTRRANGLQAYVLMVGESSRGATGELWQMAAAIPGVTVIPDPDSALATRLGAMTSGQTYAFDPSGKLLFSGGITPARGHVGENAGVDALTAILLDHRPTESHTAVFGCPLTERQP